MIYQHSPTLFARQRRLLALLDALGGTASNLDFQKLLFLYFQETGPLAGYDFVPYRFGAFSFTSYADRRGLLHHGLIELATQLDYDRLFRDYERETLSAQLPALGQIHGWVEQGERVALACYVRLPSQCHRHCVAKALEEHFGAGLAATHL